MVARNLPWCGIFGNHDDECGWSRAELLAIQQGIPGCLTLPGPAGVSGLGNFTLRVQSYRDREVAVLLCCLDTNAYAETAAYISDVSIVVDA